MPRKRRKTRDPLIKRVQQNHHYGWQGNAEWRERAEQAREFYRGKQWEDGVKELLAQQKRPSLTINHVLTIVNWFCGMQRQDRRDFRVRPRRGGMQAVANVLSGILKHAWDLADGHYEVSEMFRDGAETGKGFVEYLIDRTRDPFSGDLDVVRRSPFDVLEDPDSQYYDLRDARFVEVGEWMDRNVVEIKWPGKVDDEDADDSSERSARSTMGGIIQSLTDMVMGASRFQDEEEVKDEEATNVGRYRLRVRRTYWREASRRVWIWDRELMDVKHYAANSREAEAARMLAEKFGDRYAVTEAPGVLIHRTTWTGDHVLEHEEDVTDGVDVMPVHRFSPYWDDGYVFGVVENLIDAQKELNKRRSQALDHLNKTANSGWKVGRADPQAKRELEEFGSTPGYVFETDRFGGTLEPMEPSRLSEGHMTLATHAVDDMRAIAGSNQANLGQTDANESGILNELRQRSGQTVSEIVFDNFDRTLSQIGEGLVEVLRRSQVYSEDEIRAIVEDEDLLDEQLIEQATEEVVEDQPPPELPFNPLEAERLAPEQRQAVAEQHAQDLAAWREQAQPAIRERAEELLFEQLKRWNTGRYGVKVTQSISAPTQRLANAAEMQQIAERFPGIIPPRVFVRHSNLPDAVKEDILNAPEAPPPENPQAAQAGGGGSPERTPNERRATAGAAR